MPRTQQNSGDAAAALRLRLLRMENRITQTDLANRLGVTCQQVQKYEKGVNRISAGRLKQLSDIFGVTTNYFFDGLMQLPADRQKIVELIETHGAYQLLRAYSKIRSRRERAALVCVVEAMMRQK